MPDNDTVYGIVGKLEQVAEHERDRKADQDRHDFSGGKIFGHSGKSPFICKIN